MDILGVIKDKVLRLIDRTGTCTALVHSSAIKYSLRDDIKRKGRWFWARKIFNYNNLFLNELTWKFCRVVALCNTSVVSDVSESERV